MTEPSPRRLIAPLTGIRAVAAFWVVTRHFRTELIDAFPGLRVVAPLMNVGYLGVDLFFVLSGFILTVTHLVPMTDGYDWRKALGFLWLRIGRVWPLTAFVLLLFGGYFLVQLWTGDVAAAGQVDPGRFLQHLLLLQGWTAHPLDWNGVDWSISAEWLAYLSFSVGVVLLGRFAAVARRRTVVAWVVVLQLPVILVGASMQDDTILLFSSDGYVLSPGVLAVRVLAEFWVGALLCVLVRGRLERGRPSRLPAPTIAAVATVGVLYLVTAFDPVRRVRPGQEELYRGVDLIAPTETVVVLPLFVLLIGGLALCPRDPLARLLSTRPLVLGGRVSFALYLSHPLVIGAYVEAVARLHPGRALLAALAVGAVVAAWVFAWVLWRWVEEPCRRTARRMLPDTVRV
ncbi:acyltransferase family protein [Nakamurella endophytica]|uniref:Acyltransferase n=1 Tax=Nakamurella endophytica TaxID=1748367 RepID=A0A917SVP6_9ACTN|nr:acyltransferase [Nakamurella endophytica]GGM00956.1 acyltransferase [Nakamurella endophytica]